MTNPVRSGTCRLTIIINGVSYDVRPYERNSNRVVFRIFKKDGTSYFVGKKQDTDLFCTCMDQQRRLPVDGCKHIKAMKAIWLL